MIVVLDTETTGMEPPEAEVIEIAAVSISDSGCINGSASALIRPIRAIPPETSAVHHLTAVDFEKESYNTPVNAWQGVLYELRATCDEPIEAYVAHNAEFDKKFLPFLDDHPWLCTYRCAGHLFPDSPGFGNQTLRYYLGLQPELPGGLAPHRALYDTIVTAHLMCRLLAERNLQDLLILQNTPIIQKKIGFGEHRGKLWSEVPKDYAVWIARAEDFDPDTKATARNQLGGEGPYLLTECNKGKYKGKLWANVPKDYLQWILRQGDFDVDTVHTARYWLDGGRADAGPADGER